MENEKPVSLYMLFQATKTQENSLFNILRLWVTTAISCKVHEITLEKYLLKLRGTMKT